MLGNAPSWVAEFEALEQYFDHKSARQIVALFQKHSGIDFKKTLGISLPRGLRLSLVTDASSLFSVFQTELKQSARGEYEITNYVTALAVVQRVEVVQATLWLPIGTIEAWREVEKMDLASQLQARRWKSGP